jgi:hypothetical protein
MLSGHVALHDNVDQLEANDMDSDGGTVVTKKRVKRKQPNHITKKANATTSRIDSGAEADNEAPVNHKRKATEAEKIAQSGDKTGAKSGGADMINNTEFAIRGISMASPAPQRRTRKDGKRRDSQTIMEDMVRHCYPESLWVADRIALPRGLRTEVQAQV